MPWLVVCHRSFRRDRFSCWRGRKERIVSLSPEGRNSNRLLPPKTPQGLGERPLHFKHSPMQHLIFEGVVVISLVMAALCGTSAPYIDGSARGIPIDKKS